MLESLVNLFLLKISTAKEKKKKKKKKKEKIKLNFFNFFLKKKY